MLMTQNTKIPSRHIRRSNACTLTQPRLGNAKLLTEQRVVILAAVDDVDLGIALTFHIPDRPNAQARQR